MSKIERQYLDLLQDVLDNGVSKSDRTGTGTISVFGRQIRHRMSDGFPLLTTKRMAFKSMMTELKWFLKGDTNIKYLVENGCNIWNGDAYKNYVSKVNVESIAESFGTEVRHHTMEEFIERIKTDDKFAKEWGELGPIYGKQWRDWERRTTREEKIVNPGVYTKQIDQIKNLIKELKTNPDSRRLMVSAWNVGEMDNMVLPPCHYGFQVYTRELSEYERLQHWTNSIDKSIHYADDITESKLDALRVPKSAISLMWNQRSVDTFLGLPFNIASYGTLLMLLAEETNMIPEELIGNLGDVHLYKNHIDQAKEQLRREPYELPTLEITNCDVKKGEFNYNFVNYIYHPSIFAPLSN